MNNYIKNFSERRYYLDSVIINSVLVKTYLLLSSTILFSALMTFISIKTFVRPIGFFPMLIIYFGLLFLINLFKRTLISIFFVFLLTGFLGYYIGPYINYILSTKNGGGILFFSLSLTSIIFLFLSFYSFITRKNFSFLNNFIFVGSIVVVFCIIFNLFFYIKLLHLVISGFLVILSSSIILYEISSVINDGESDYINVTVSLYLSIYNIFLSLLNIFGFISSDN